MPTSEGTRKAEAAILYIVQKGGALGEATRLVMETAFQRSLEKEAAIGRLMAKPAKEGEKPLSATAAERLCESDEWFAAFEKRRRQAEVWRIEAEATYEAALRSADLAVRLVGLTEWLAVPPQTPGEGYHG